MRIVVYTPPILDWHYHPYILLFSHSNLFSHAVYPNSILFLSISRYMLYFIICMQYAWVYVCLFVSLCCYFHYRHPIIFRVFHSIHNTHTYNKNIQSIEVNWLVIWPSLFQFNYPQLFEESKKTVNKFIGPIEHYTGIAAYRKSWWPDNRNKRKIPLCRKMALTPSQLICFLTLARSFTLRLANSFFIILFVFFLSLCFQIT